MIAAWTANELFDVNFRNRGEQSITLADELEQDIIVCFDTVIKQHKEVSRKIHSDVQLVTKYAQERRKAHDKLARRPVFARMNRVRVRVQSSCEVGPLSGIGECSIVL
ncbi:unnamed protein product [Symbiodinium sp. CCMP2592]|nr:unnamed protein product [Symbiodinium sp. CCMP2592]